MPTAHTVEERTAQRSAASDPNNPRRFDLHGHYCRDCDYVWFHVRDPTWTEDQKVAAHTCKYCGGEVWFWHRDESGAPILPVELVEI